MLPFGINGVWYTFNGLIDGVYIVLTMLGGVLASVGAFYDLSVVAVYQLQVCCI